MSTKNPYSVSHAIAYALSQNGKACTPGLCDHYVGVWYGWGHSGEYTAASHWAHIPKAYRSNRAYPGMLAFYSDGGAGHVAIITAATGAGGFGGTILTPDLPRRGRFSLQKVTAPMTVWGMKFLGYANPYFPHGTSPVHTPIYPVNHS